MPKETTTILTMPIQKEDEDIVINKLSINGADLLLDGNLVLKFGDSLIVSSNVENHSVSLSYERI